MYEIYIASSINHKKLFAQIEYYEYPFAEVNQESKKGLRVILYRSKNNITFMLEDFQMAVEVAKQMLLDDSIPPINRFKSSI
jgi:hypothetical protein